MNTRALAVSVLLPVFESQRPFQPAAISAPKLSAADRAFMVHLCFGVLRWYPRLCTLGTQLLSKPFSKKDQDLWLLLLIGMYQLAYLQTPAHAAIYETVAATDSLKKPWARGVINAALRRFDQEKDALNTKFSRDQVCQSGHPIWLLRKIQKDWPEQASAILDNNQSHPPFHLRVNSQRITRAQYQERLNAAGITSHPDPWALEALSLESAVDLKTLPGFSEGLVSVQDLAAQWALLALDLQGTEKVLDACAAPGGKTAHMLERYPQLQVTAWEREPVRLERLVQTLERLHLRAKLQLGDATILAQNTAPGTFDRILIDTPCSGSGVIRRHPEIKYHIDDAAIAALCAQQAALLDSLWPLLRTGGRLVYTTCSIFPEENHEQISAFLARTADAQPIVLEFPWSHALSVGNQMLPGEHQADGFFYAVISKK